MSQQAKNDGGLCAERTEWMNRRSVLRLLPAAGLTIVTSDLLSAQGKEQIEVTPAEDLMREHGLLKRILLVYEEISRRIAANKDFPIASVTDSAKIIRSFIEEYHEKLEEDYLFPRFRKHRVLVDLVDTLQQQHQAGRRVTERILVLSTSVLKSAADKNNLSDALRAFVRMYAPHEAREETVLLLSLHQI